MVSPKEYQNVEHYFRKHRVQYKVGHDLYSEFIGEKLAYFVDYFILQVLMQDVQHEINHQLRRVDTHVIPDDASDRVGNSGWRRGGKAWH